MRVSDDERQRVIDELRRHCAAGRLDVDEYAARIEQALAATSLEDLDRVLRDLPMLRIADPTGTSAPSDRGAGGRGGPGRLVARAVVLVSVMVVLGAVTLATVLSWAWAAVLVAGWLLGMVQGRALARRRH